jgi:hypothetical protein
MGIVSKTKYRQHSKSALKATNSFAARRECLMQVDFREVKDELNASQFKTVAFHFSQLIGLMRGREYFTKADLATAFPDLAPFLHRCARPPARTPAHARTRTHAHARTQLNELFLLYWTRADDATVHLEVLNKYRDIFVMMIDEGLQVHAKGPLLLFAADPASCNGRWNTLTYESRYGVAPCLWPYVRSSLCVPCVPCVPCVSCVSCVACRVSCVVCRVGG